jgi:peptidyl-tRNA hydrolase
MEVEQQPTLYIIMRKDLPDMNPGKIAAQASHATSDFHDWEYTVRLHQGMDQVDVVNDLIRKIDLWKEDRSFGRTIVLEGTLEEMKEVVRQHKPAGLVTDPTYPWRNWSGEVFTSEEITCAWCFIFDRENAPQESLQKLQLHW